MINSRKLITLWSVVALAYVLIIVLSNPLFVMSEAQQQEVYAAVTAAMCEADATAPPEQTRPRPNQPLSEARTRALVETARELKLTNRVVLIIYENGVEQGWPPAPCGG